MKFKFKLFCTFGTILYCFLYLMIGFRLIKIDRKFSKNVEFENKFCKRIVNISYANHVAEEYMTKENDYFKECDTLGDIFCDSVKTSAKSAICKLFKSNNVVYSMQLNLKLLVRLFNVNENHIKCTVDAFDKVFNEPSELGTKTYRTEEFLKNSNYTIYTNKHGYYNISCNRVTISKSIKLYEDFYYIFPFNMSTLIKERQEYSTENNIIAKKMNVFIFKIDSLSYQHFQRVMPKTCDYLTKNLDINFVYKNLNSVGENTHPNLIPLFSGLVVEPIESLKLKPEVYKFSKLDNGFYDNLPFVWYDYEKKGYFTGYHVSLRYLK